MGKILGLLLLNMSSKCFMYIDAGDPLTAVEQEEKERLLEEVSVSTNSSWDYNYLYCCRRLTSLISRDFQHGVEETSIPLSGLVRSMVAMT